MRLLALFTLAAASLSAQNITATITGSIKDATGAVMPNANVRAINTGTQASFQVKADSDGSYTLRTIPVGVYNIRVEAAGFTAWEARDVRLQVNEIARVDATLNVASTTESVTVSSNVVNVDTTSATLRTVVDQKRIEELPLNGRNATQLMRLVAGVVADPRADVTSGTTYPGTTPVSVNGGRANATNYVLDGAQNNDLYSNAPSPLPNPDALQEFSVQTNNFSAEFGRQSGGLVNAVTKSGTNEFHGSAFEFVRNQALNATNFFAPPIAPGSTTKRQDGLKRNQFGATIGGPVHLPKIYNGKDKTFFFFSYQGTLQRQVPADVQRIVPTTLQRAGNFSQLTRALRDPDTNAPFAGNLIPASRINPVSRFIIDNTLPDGGAAGRITTTVPTPFNDHQYMVRGDHQFSDRNRLSGRYYRSNANSPAFLNQANLLEQTSGGKWFNESVVLTDTHTVSPTIVNQFLFSLARTDGYFVPPQPTRSLTDLGIRYYNDPIIKWDINIAGYFRINTGDTNAFPRRELQFLDTVRWTKGKHNLTLGGEYSRGRNDIINNFRANGVWDFNGAAPFTSDGLADFMIGRFNSLTQGIGEYKNTRVQRVGLFIQDSWKATRRLTVDVGARWEPFFPFTDEVDRIATWHPGAQSTRYPNAPRGVIYAGDNVPKGTVPTAWARLGPRMGFAWDVFGDGKTALRGAYGMFFDSFNAIATNSQANQAPFGTVVSVFGTLNNTFSDPWRGTTNPFPGQKNPPRDVAFPDFSTHFLNAHDFRNPYVQSWNLTLERELGAGFITRVAYAASKGTRLMTLREINAAVYAPGVTTATTNQRRPFAPRLGQTTLVEPVGNSTYHALQWTVERRFRKGYTILANYQFSRSLDDTSANKGTGQVRTNPNSQAFDKGLSDFQRQHVFTFSGLWELPIRFENKLANSLIGGWSLNSIMTLYAGQPINIVSGVDNARTGTGNQRADLTGDARLDTSRSRNDLITEWLRRAAFAPNALGTFGNHGRNVFIGPGLANVDLGLGKQFKLGENIATTFRFEAFNAFNRPNLGNPTTAQNNGNFMRITSAADPRILQLALRLTF